MDYYKTYKALRIPAGWEVTNNCLVEDVDQLTYDDPELQYRSEYNVLSFYSQRRNLSISVNWKFENEKGYYTLDVFRVLEIFNPMTNSQDLQWEEKPSSTFLLNGTELLVEKLEELLWFSKPYEDPRILKNRGEVDQPSESYRLSLLKKGVTSELIDKILLDGNKQIQHMALSHKEITKEFILRFLNESRFTKMKKKAEELLKKRKFK